MSRPRRFSAPIRGAFGAGAGRAAAPPAPRRGRGRLIVIGFERRPGARLGRRCLAAETLLGDLVGLVLDVFVVLAAFFFVAFARFGRGALGRDRFLRGCGERRASSSARSRSSVSRSRASASAWARALRSSSVSVRSTTPDDFGDAAAAPRRGGGASAPPWPGAGAAARLGAAARSGAAATGSALASPGPMRRFTFSTTTALLRPWLKLWRTTPCSTPPRLSVSVFVGVTLSFSPVFFVVSAIRYPVPYAPIVAAGSARVGPAGPTWAILAQIAGPKPFQAPQTRQKRVARGPGEQGCMYHIWAAQCQIQLRRGQEFNHRDRTGLGAPPERGIELSHPVGGSLRGVQERDDLAHGPARLRPW